MKLYVVLTLRVTCRTQYSLLDFQLGSWILTLVTFPLAFLVVRSIKETNYNDEKVREVLSLFQYQTNHLWLGFQQMVFVDDLQAGEAGAQEVVADSDSAEKGSIKSETPRV